MKLESLNGSRFEPISKESLRFVNGGEEGTSLYAHYVYKGKEYLDVKDRWENGKEGIYCWEAYIDGEWVDINY